MKSGSQFNKRFNKFFNTHYGLFIATVQKIVKKYVAQRPHIKVSDIVQEFFIKKLTTGEIDELIEKLDAGEVGYFVQALKYFTIDQLRKDKTKKNVVHKPLEINEESSAFRALALKEEEVRNYNDACKRAVDELREIFVAGPPITLAVFDLWRKDFTNKEIANDLSLTRSQVEYHKHKIKSTILRQSGEGSIQATTVREY